MDRILDSGSNDWGSTPHGDTKQIRKLPMTGVCGFFLCQHCGEVTAWLLKAEHVAESDHDGAASGCTEVVFFA